MIDVGGRLISSLRVGETPVDAVYRGGNLILKQYSGIQVFRDKAVVNSANGAVDELNTDGISSWFVALIDMGESATRRVEFGYFDGIGQSSAVNMRLFDSLDKTSADFWTITNTVKTQNFVKSRYALATVSIANAGKFYMKDVNTGEYFAKGISVI